MHEIKAIIFDLGGVLIDLDFEKVSEAFKALEVENFDELYSQSKADLVFENFEVNKISEEIFCESLRSYAKKPITNQDVVNAWNAILLDFRIESLEALKRLKEKYRIFLLSNTNSIHLKAFNKIFQTTIGESAFTDLFEKAYYSHEIGLRKPNPEAYKYVLHENKLKAAETLFIDDTYQNIEGAKKVGLQTILLTKGIKIENLNL